MGYGRINMYQALGGINSTTYYYASVYLYNSRAVLSNPSGTNPVARHVFADNNGGTVNFSVQKGDPNGVTITSAEVKITNPDGSTDTLALAETVVSSTLSTYTATKAVLPQLVFSVGATTFVPEIVLTDSGAKTTKIPLPAYTIPGPVPVSLEVSVSPPTVDVGGTAVLTIKAKDSGGNVIQNVPISGTLVIDPGGGGILSSVGGDTPVYQPVLTLSSVPGNHVLVFSVNSSGYESVAVSVTVTGIPQLSLRKSVSPAGPVCAGQALTYTISWSKGGTSTVYGITITDTLPNGTAYTAPSIDFFAQTDGFGVPLLADSAYSSAISGPWISGEPLDGTGPPLVLRWTVDRLAPGHSGYLRYSVLVSSTLTAGSTVWNRASATIASDSSAYWSNTPSNTIATPGTLVSRLSAPRYASVAQWFPMTLTVTNTGATPVTGVFPEMAIGPGSGLAEVIYSPIPLAVLAPGSSTNFTWTVSASGSGNVTFTATASGTACGFMAVQTASGVSATMQTPAVLAGSPITFIPTDTCVGRQLRICLSATNTGEASAVQVTGAPALSLEGPATAALVSSPAMIPVLAGGYAANFTWTYTLTGAGSLKYTATVSGLDANSGLPASTGPLTSASITVRNAGILTTQATTAAPSVCSTGQVVDVRLNVKNTGADDVVNILPQMNIASGGTLITLRSGPSPSGPLSLSPGMSQAFTWTYTTSGSGQVSFQPSAAGDTCGGSPLSAGGQAGLQVERPSHLVVSATATPPMREVGQPFDVVFTIWNDGEAQAYWAQPDALPTAYGTGVAMEWKQTKTGPDHLSGGESNIWRWSYTPTGTGSLVFSATAYGMDENSLLYVYSGTVTGRGVTIVPAGSMALAVTSAQVSPRAVFTAEAITVSITVQNTGTTPLWGVIPSVQPVAGGGASVALVGTSPASADLAAGASATFVVTYRADSAGTVAFQVGASAAEGSVYSTQVVTEQVIISAGCKALVVTSAQVSPKAVFTSEDITVSVTIQNIGTVPRAGVVPVVQPVLEGGALVTSVGTVPASVDLAPDASATFTVTYRADRAGKVLFQAGATATGESVNAAQMATDQVTITSGCMALVVTSASVPSRSVFTGETIAVSVTVHNIGRVSRGGVAPVIEPVLEGGASVTPAGTVPISATLAADTSATFIVTFRADNAGTVLFQAGATATGESVNASQKATEKVVIYVARGRVVVYPNPVKLKGSVRGTVKFHGLKKGGKLTIYTFRGIRVWEGRAGEDTVEWDGKNTRGEAVIPGAYPWVAETGKGYDRGTVIVE